MTRKHFEAIAATIKAIPFTNENDRVIAACRLADEVCAPANPNFTPNLTGSREDTEPLDSLAVLT